jgi:hypothetical protein
MLLVDDFLIKPFLSILDILHSMALREVYDVASLKEDIKENQLLFELGERTKDEYETKKLELESQLNLAEAVHEQISGRVEVKGG